jgi:hypothetical protein
MPIPGSGSGSFYFDVDSDAAGLYRYRYLVDYCIDLTSDDPSIISYEVPVSGSEWGFRLWLDPVRVSYWAVPLVGSFEEAGSSGIFPVTRYHVPWLKNSVQVQRIRCASGRSDRCINPLEPCVI